MSPIEKEPFENKYTYVNHIFWVDFIEIFEEFQTEMALEFFENCSKIPLQSGTMT